METVFVGLVAEIDYVWGVEGHYFRVTCLDAKFLMMKTQRLEVYTGRKVSEEIGGMLSSQPFSAYITGKAIDDTGKPEEELFLACEDDYTLAVGQAKRLGYEFFIVAGKVYYRKPPSSSPVIMQLSTTSGLLEARFSVRAGSLFKTAEVVGLNPQNGKPLKAQAAINGKFSKGATASKMLGNTKKSVYLRSLTDASEASARAKAMMAEAQGEFGRLQAKCIGIPELVPGRSVKISGLMPEANKTFYILNVSHTVDEDGFVTTLEAKVDTL
jgi:phage protein D